MQQFLCPICQKELVSDGKSLSCKNRHTFDLSKSGYVNLLPPNAKHSKNPGDNKLMVDARRNFLEKGYYLPLSRTLCAQALRFCKGLKNPCIVDAGCGEGYYTSQIWESLAKVTQPEIFGIDISKFALNIAAKKNKSIRYAVGSVHHLPVASESCDLLFNLFAPYSGEEFQRVLKKDGIFIMVIPGKDHLFGLKEAIYEQAYQNKIKDYALTGFQLLDKVVVEDKILLKSQEDIKNLFMMTPYYYKTSQSNKEKLDHLESLETKISFEILIYQKEKI